ncbi:hypothetical protein D9M68_489540 [compost metagenome]
MGRALPHIVIAEWRSKLCGDAGSKRIDIAQRKVLVGRKVQFPVGNDIACQQGQAVGHRLQQRDRHALMA